MVPSVTNQSAELTLAYADVLELMLLALSLELRRCAECALQDDEVSP